MACINDKCVNPCTELTPCSSSATCSVLDTSPVRTMICECPDQWVPDANGDCQRVVLVTPTPGCQQDSECPDHESCINRQCRNPCNCGLHSICKVQLHRATCSCEPGFEGNPNTACRTVGCTSDSECDSGKACYNRNCTSICLVDNPCGPNAECYVADSRARCRCLSGYRGNPLDRCDIVGCRSNADCPSDKSCDHAQAQCVNPCVYDSQCSSRAECVPQNHMAVCRCPTGLIGNPYIDCRPEILPDCTLDTDCPSRLACIANKCLNPCNELEPCQRPARCEVIPSSPVRTMNCICPDGYVSSGSGTCQPVFKIDGCISDSDCGSNEACINNICTNPCNCGRNAECRIRDHKPVCSCDQGYQGNPEIQCFPVECEANSDCLSTHQCINRQCVPACSADLSSCGARAECFGINHRAVCECPPGLTGHPEQGCVLIGCQSNSECPSEQSCINNRCENPCNTTVVCHKTEVCKVYQHQPECACPPGTVADNNRGCIQRDEQCHDDGECPSKMGCIGGTCVELCGTIHPCGVNAECKVLDHVPVRTMVCECLPGYQGNAAVQCDKRKCYALNSLLEITHIRLIKYISKFDTHSVF